jgi:TatD DNase family protein
MPSYTKLATMELVDVHAHLIHKQFAGEEDEVALRAKEAGLTYVIVNGLEPKSNDATLALCEKFDHLLPALGIYPVDALAPEIAQDGGWEYDFPAPIPFDVDAEIRRIDDRADQLVAIGEIGLDRYWVKEHWERQEEVFRALIQVAQKHDKPIIIHSRKAEARCFEVLQEMGVERADFHCYGGKLKLAQKIAEAGYYLSIPPVVERAESFQRIVQKLPLSQLLTETDCPYMGPDKDVRNEPANVARGIRAMAKARDISEQEMASIVRENFRRLFRL